MTAVPALVTPEMRALCLEARDELIRAHAELKRAHAALKTLSTDSIKTRFALASALLILEAEATPNSDKSHVCALIRSVCGEPPRRSKPQLHIDNGGLTS